MKKIVITQGDPAGIGLEVIEKAFKFRKLHPDAVYIIYGQTPNLNTEKITNISQANTSGKLYHLDFGQPHCTMGVPSKSSGEYSLRILQQVIADQSEIDAVVTAPISKEAIQLTEPEFIGHTEFFAQGSNDFVMSFFGPYFNLALLTTHLPLSAVESTISKEFFQEKIRIIYHETNKILPNPKFAMLAVNPHAGEKGAFGTIDEEIKTWLTELEKAEGIKIDGVFPADTFFAYHAQKYQMIISAYHDQGLVPFKMLSKGQGVNTTLGLPFIRTSVDHGTGYDIAGKNLADAGSMESALDFAEKCLHLEQSQPQSYSYLAEIYDDYMQHVDYPKWADFILDAYKKYTGKSPDKILELACGTGNIACELVKLGYNVTAEDLNEQMLKIANSKPNAPQLRLANMLDASDENIFDLALLIFDSLNYLQSTEEISRLLTTVHSRVTPNGIFIFDISTLKNCHENFDGLLDYQKIAENFMVQESLLQEDTQITKFDVFKKNGYLYDLHHEIHKQKIYPVETLLYLIEKSPWTLLGIYSNWKLLTDSQKAEAEDRLFFVLQK